MASLSLLLVLRNAQRRRHLGLGLRIVAYNLALLLAASSTPCATAQKVPDCQPGSHSAEPKTADASAEKDSNKSAKYNVRRIGQRGVGHGFNLYSLRREHELGERLAASLDRTTKRINDPVVNEYVNRLAQTIVRHSDAEIPFTIKVIDSGDIPRAYGLPGGFLYVSSALILASEGEAELAGVMAHEIAHVTARHATRAVTRREVSNVVDSLAYMTGIAGLVWQDLGGPLTMKKFARNAEYEADLLGIEYAWAAGYDPQALLDALEKLHAIEVKRDALFAKIPGYRLANKIPFHSKILRGFASYPLTEERITRLQSEIGTFLPDRKDYILDTNQFQEVKSLLLASRTPVLRRHDSEENGKGPVLRRRTDPDPGSELRPFRGLALLP